MSDSVIKRCRSCEREVDPKHTGKCPHCNKQEGYNVSVTINEVVKLSDSLKVTKKTLEDAYDEQLKKYDEKIKDVTDSKKKRILDITRRLLVNHKEKELNRISKKIDELPGITKETKKKTFTIDAVLVEAPPKPEDVKKSVEKYVKLSTDEALSEISKDLKEIKNTTDETHKKIIKLSSKKTLFLGFGIGVGASSLVWFLTTIPNWIKDLPPIIIANVTNSTIQP